MRAHHNMNETENDAETESGEFYRHGVHARGALVSPIKSLDRLVWLRFRSPHCQVAAPMLRTSEPLHSVIAYFATEIASSPGTGAPFSVRVETRSMLAGRRPASASAARTCASPWG